MSGEPPPGWYDDPDVPGQERFWDGQRWLDGRRTRAQAAPEQAADRSSETEQWTSRGLGPQHRPTGFQPHVLVVIIGLVVMVGALLSFLVVEDIARQGEGPLRLAMLGAFITVVGLLVRQSGVTWDSPLGRQRGDNESSGSAIPPAGRPDASAPLTPEQRLDRLLLMHQNGQISDAEYQTARQRIIGDL